MIIAHYILSHSENGNEIGGVVFEVEIDESMFGKRLCYIGSHKKILERILRRPSTTKRASHWEGFIFYLNIADIFRPKHGHLQCKII